MSEFLQDIFKILLDKLLLGLIAAGFGFYLSRLLEDYRTRNTYQMLVMKERIDAYRRLMDLISDHHGRVMGLFQTLKKVVEKHPEKLSDEETASGYAYIESYQEFQNRVAPFMAYVSYDVADALIEYFKSTLKVTNLVKRDFTLGVPNEEELSEALVKFVHTCGESMRANPFERKSSKSANKNRTVPA